MREVHPREHHDQLDGAPERIWQQRRLRSRQSLAKTTKNVPAEGIRHGNRSTLNERIYPVGRFCHASNQIKQRVGRQFLGKPEVVCAFLCEDAKDRVGTQLVALRY
jgi:hypothetical protein